MRLRVWVLVRTSGGEGLRKNALCGTPSGSGPQSQIAVAQLSHEASLHNRSAEPMWRFAPAIHRLRDFPEALPARGGSAAFVRAPSTASEQCVFGVGFIALCPPRPTVSHGCTGARCSVRATD